MATKDLRSYFNVLKNNSDGKYLPEILATTVNVTSAEVTAIDAELNKSIEPPKKYNANLPPRIKKEVGTL